MTAINIDQLDLSDEADRFARELRHDYDIDVHDRLDDILGKLPQSSTMTMINPALIITLLSLHGLGGPHHLGGAFKGEGDSKMLVSFYADRQWAFYWNNFYARFWRYALNRLMQYHAQSHLERSDFSFKISPHMEQSGMENGLGPKGLDNSMDPLSEWRIMPAYNSGELGIGVFSNELVGWCPINEDLVRAFKGMPLFIEAALSLVRRGLATALQILPDEDQERFPKLLGDEYCDSPISTIKRWEELFNKAQLIKAP